MVGVWGEKGVCPASHTRLVIPLRQSSNKIVSDIIRILCSGSVGGRKGFVYSRQLKSHSSACGLELVWDGRIR